MAKSIKCHLRNNNISVAVDEVAKEQVVPVRTVASLLEELEEVVELAMDVSTDLNEGSLR